MSNIEVRADGPLLTFRDEATGERTDLDATALATWVARTASLLRDGCGLRAGDRVAVLLPAHWQTAAILLGAWSLGLTVSFRPWSTAGLVEGDGRVDAVFVARHRVDGWLERVPQAPHRFVLSFAAHGAAGDPVPDGYQDFIAAVRQYPDPVPDYAAVQPTDAASPDGTTFGQWAAIAADIAASHGLKPGSRVLVDAATDPQPVTWLLAPLTVGASVVVCANLDHARVADLVAAEGITHVQ